MKETMNEEAVSPVIGTILMVAITVILAAVIAAFVFGMAGTTQTTKNVGLIVSLGNTTASTPHSGVLITIQGGTDLGSLNNIKWSIDGGKNTPAITYYADESNPVTFPLKVGQIVTTVNSSGSSGQPVSGSY